MSVTLSSRRAGAALVGCILALHVATRTPARVCAQVSGPLLQRSKTHSVPGSEATKGRTSLTCEREFVPVAAGALYPLLGLFLNPMIASAAMSLSSFSVITNALRLRQLDLDPETDRVAMAS